MLNDKIQFRTAHRDESRIVAQLYSLSSDGVANYIWSLMAEEGQNLLDVGEQRYSRENTDFSYQNATVAVLDNEVVGMIVAFPIHVDPDMDLSEIDPVLVPYCKLEEDNSYYICGVSLFEPYRSQGIGSAFMKRAEEDGRAKGFKKMSLIVFEENTGAKKLYDRLGYREVAREKIVPHPLIHFTGDAVLMVKDLA